MLLLWLLLALPGPTFSESGHASPLWEIANMTSWEGTSSGAPVGGHAAMATCGVAMATCGVATVSASENDGADRATGCASTGD